MFRLGGFMPKDSPPAGTGYIADKFQTTKEQITTTTGTPDHQPDESTAAGHRPIGSGKIRRV